MDVKVGDTVILDKRSYPFYLERSKYNSNFDGDKQFIVIQKRFILAVIN
jgi:co-chaperonin GroES (HSP10)